MQTERVTFITTADHKAALDTTEGRRRGFKPLSRAEG